MTRMAIVAGLCIHVTFDVRYMKQSPLGPVHFLIHNARSVYLRSKRWLLRLRRVAMYNTLLQDFRLDCDRSPCSDHHHQRYRVTRNSHVWVSG